ncbi:2Fe-2S iron-sulfur cluster-binding protein [Metapseudomonas boanensis]|uniref:2Fe-2S iron-sulfur cluster binding domain-containing protein n=1 Tax=Metapseudomonas boanensis TaxID=2822138 RepID=A0ABS5XGA2_9GAMM|nr:2Fe-2S iron-sulfur cluster-binding protein [Pseudomonas boanensis]MBT8766723.1 2Fe-2S iron-sulfur cluster binding domain-containing protein [Pseudomonas boanensis]
MITLTFVQPDDSRTQIQASSGANLMEVAVAHGIDGILADCGGNLVCGTCHVVVPERFQALLPEQSDMERDMLDCVPFPQPYTRLCCQITLEAAHDGLELQIPLVQR